MMSKKLHALVVMLAWLTGAASIWALCTRCVNGRGDGQIASDGQRIVKCFEFVDPRTGGCRYYHGQRCDIDIPACHCTVVAVTLATFVCGCFI
jgi:hypothetical protein